MKRGPSPPLGRTSNSPEPGQASHGTTCRVVVLRVEYILVQRNWALRLVQNRSNDKDQCLQSRLEVIESYPQYRYVNDSTIAGFRANMQEDSCSKVKNRMLSCEDRHMSNLATRPSKPIQASRENRLARRYLNVHPRGLVDLPSWEPKGAGPRRQRCCIHLDQVRWIMFYTSEGSKAYPVVGG